MSLFQKRLCLATPTLLLLLPLACTTTPDLPAAAPQPVSPAAPPPEGARRLASIPFENDPSLAFEVYRAHERSELECTTSDLLIRLVEDGQVRAESTLEGSCVGACTQEAKQQGARERDAIREDIRRGEASSSELHTNFTTCQSFEPRYEGALRGLGQPVLLVTQPVSAPHGNTQSPLHLMAWGCSRLVRSEPISGSKMAAISYYEPARTLDIQWRPSASGDASWERFSLFSPTFMGSPVEPSEQWTVDVTWQPERCAWDVKRRD